MRWGWRCWTSLGGEGKVGGLLGVLSSWDGDGHYEHKFYDAL